MINSNKTSLLLDAHTNLAIGHPSSLAIYPAKILPKLPQGTTKLNGVTVPVILCHADSHKLKLGNNHGDVYNWFNRFGKTM